MLDIDAAHQQDVLLLAVTLSSEEIVKWQQAP